MQTTLPMPTTPRTRTKAFTANHLRLPQTFAFGAWITEHKQLVQDEPDAVCAERAARDLGFPITPANVAGYRAALKIDKTKPNTPPSLEERVIELEQQNELLSRKCDSIDRNLAVQFTTILTDLAKKNDEALFEVNQTLANLRAGYNDHQTRITKHEDTLRGLTVSFDPVSEELGELPIDLPTDPGAHA